MPPLVVHLSTLARRAGDQWQILDARPVCVHGAAAGLT